MVKPKGSTADEWEIDLLWTDPAVSHNPCAWPRYCSGKCFGDIYALAETCVVYDIVVEIRSYALEV